MLRTRLVAGINSGFVLSASFATALLFVALGDSLIEPWRVDPVQPAPITLRLPRNLDAQPGAVGQLAGGALVARGQVAADAHTAIHVRTYESQRRPPRPSRMAAQWVIYFLLLMTATAYFRHASSQRAGLLRTQVALLAMALLFLLVAKTYLIFTPFRSELLPVAMVPLWAATFVDRRTGLMLGGLMSVLAVSLQPYDPLLLVVYLGTSATSVLAYRRRRRTIMPLVGGLMGGLVGAVAYLATEEVFGFLDWQQALVPSLDRGATAALAGGLIAGVLAISLAGLVSRSLGMVSRNQLMNLHDVEQPLLQKIAKEAPGSWEHSRAMANLAEAAAAAIGADAQLTRVGAYYHDLGKTIQPNYFVENLAPGEESPHDALDPDVSADAIMAHVVEGTRILREGGIPEPVIEFAYTHHGTSTIEFFWHKCLKEGNPRNLTEEAFKYPGMRPRTKETAILMLIDAIEAGARTVVPPSREGFQELVRRVIFVKLQQGQLDASGLELSELRVVAGQIVDTLCSAYHARIRYPWQDKEESGTQSSPGEEAAATDSPRTTPVSQPGVQPRASGR